MILTDNLTPSGFSAFPFVIQNTQLEKVVLKVCGLTLEVNRAGLQTEGSLCAF